MTEKQLAKLMDIAAMPIQRAWVCEHCQTVANQQDCPYCSGSGYPLAALLNRPDREETNELS